MHGWDSYLAIGDSFTEGLSDTLPDGSYRGWADRLAELLGEDNPRFRYANLALRGKMLREILDEQLPIALEVKPDLVTLCAGGNDVILPGSDVDELAGLFEEGVRSLLAAGIDVLIFTGPDPKVSPVVRLVRSKVAIYNSNLHAIAERHGVRIVDLWSMSVLSDRRAWSDDRLHFTAEGHRRIALRTAEVLGLPVKADWREPWPTVPEDNWMALRRRDLEWTREHLIPWIRRQLRGESMGDGLTPKRPELAPLISRQGNRWRPLGEPAACPEPRSPQG
ncbi:lysophospholipase L1-like esterase [Tamaricihabitans halophyticus]|uniref:Lysophospholipase L1-like esterase n=1 Tax=Tamaricihabitans halophyticus TaxID=1262583 RepID=A0A4R2R1R0_9PSEU|nr:SGNH/GDSL hydrolase family protein [Tamaricihabitans halophyticus]TCP56622.1 lysophospholipase L1-like esterase [Tamaricihabitans halophyticus]